MDRRPDRRHPQGLLGRQRHRRRHRRQERNGAVRLQRAALRAGRRHHRSGAPLGHRAQGQGLHSGPGREQGRLRRQGRKVRRLGRRFEKVI